MKDSRQRRKINKETLVKELAKYLPKSTLQMVTTQIRIGNKKSKGKRWTLSEKAMALSLLHASPKAYRTVRKIISLPSVSTLRRVMQKVGIYPGFNDNILQALKKNLSSDKSKQLCIVAFDEMALKEEATYNIEQDNIEGLEDFGDNRTRYLANHATVFMVRGILAPWKQAIGYFLSSGPISGDMLHSLLLKCLGKLAALGLTVKAVVCDQGSNNRKAIERLGITEENTHFVFNGEKIFVVYDPPHLLKNVRNNLKKKAASPEMAIPSAGDTSRNFITSILRTMSEWPQS